MESSSGRRLMLQGRRAADDNAQSSSSSPTRGPGEPLPPTASLRGCHERSSGSAASAAPSSSSSSPLLLPKQQQRCALHHQHHQPQHAVWLRSSQAAAGRRRSVWAHATTAVMAALLFLSLLASGPRGSSAAGTDCSRDPGLCGGLHQVCVVSGADTSSGSSSSGSCKCAPGMQMAPNSTCVDVNECEASPDICGVSGTCTNTAPGYACACGGASVLAEADGVLGGTCVGNIAAGRPAYASSSASEDSGPDKAVDGLTDATAAPLFHTLLDGRTWISLDLGGVARISRFRIWNRADCCGYRLRDAELRVGNTSLTSPSTTNLSAIFPTLVWKQQPPATGAATGEVLDVALEQPVAARWVTLQNFNSRSGDGYLALRELQVFGRLIISQPIAQASKRQPPVMPVPENTDGGGSGAGAAGKKKRRSKSPSPSPNPSPSPSPNARKRTRGGVPPSPAPT